MLSRIKKHPLLVCIFPLFVVIIYVALLDLISEISIFLSAALTLLLQAVVSLFCVFYRHHVLSEKAGYTRRKLLLGLFLLGLPFWYYTVNNFIGSSGPIDVSFLDGLPYLLLNFLLSIGVGFAEESIFRVLVYGTFRHYLVSNRKGIFLAALLASICFGLTHIVNLIVMPQLKIYTLAQIIYAFEIGFYFCALYERTKNILTCIIQHTLFDFVAFFWTVYSSVSYEASLTDIDLSTAIFIIAFYLPLVIYAVFLFSGKIESLLFGTKQDTSVPEGDPEGFVFD